MLLVFLLFSMNFLFFHPVQEPALTVLPVWDRKGTNFFLSSKFFLNFFEKILLHLYQPLCPPRLRSAKVETFSYPPKLFLKDFYFSISSSILAN